MFGLAKNYDALCNYLRVVDNLDSPIRQELEGFLVSIRTDLYDGTPLSENIIKRIPAIFELRIAALKWLATEQANVIELFDSDVYPYFEKLTQITRLSALAENILFALRCNKKVLNAILNIDIDQSLPDNEAINLPTISYQQFETAILLSSPNEKQTKAILELANSSFKIEYVICAAAMIHDEKLIVSSEKIDELSAVIIDAAQNYSALSAELGLIPSKKVTNHDTEVITDAASLQEQKNIAEADFNSFAHNWKD